MATVRGRGSSEFSIDQSVEDKVRLQRIRDSNRPTDKFPIGRLNYYGDHCYAYSGSIANTSGSAEADTTMMIFVTGSEYIIGNFQLRHNHKSGHDLYYTIKFNDIIFIC